MKKTIIVASDFSASSLNALDYACGFARDYNLNILVTYIYTIPGSYAGEGLSLASINDAINSGNERLDEEVARVKDNYPGVEFESRMITGNFLESLQNLKAELGPALIIIGAIGEYSELWLWDNDWLNALITVSCPVLIIPAHITYTPILNVAFACDFKNTFLPHQTDIIKKLVKASGAKFYVVHVTPQQNLVDENKTTIYKDAFSDIATTYHIVENKLVIKGIAEFIKQFQIDLLMVIPHQHGLWHNLLNKSYTKQLALLNNLPVMAIHETD